MGFGVKPQHIILPHGVRKNAMQISCDIKLSLKHGKLTYSYCFTLYRVQGAKPPYYSSDSDFSSSSSFSEGVIVVFTIDAPSASLITITPAAVLE